MHQIGLDRKSNTAFLDLNSSFYPMHLVQQTVAEFKNTAKISLRERKGRLLLSIKPKGNKDAEETALHFCNFALALKRELGQHA